MFEGDLYEEAETFMSPFDEIGVNFNEQTGADWMSLMLSASLGGVVVEGVALSGSCEVICKTDFITAETTAVGRIKFLDRPKVVESVDVAGMMVAKSTAKFRGIGRANAFGLAMEDTLWSSTSVSRVRDGAFLAASLVAMGAKVEDATAMTSDIMGESLPESVVSSVVTPLALAKRDAATTVKNRSVVFLPQYALQPVIWDDTPLQGRLIDEKCAIDWGRVTGIAKYVGAMNSLVDDKFRLVAENVGVPYRLVKGHYATVTNTPYRVADDWVGVKRVMSPFGSAVENASDIAESVSAKVRLTVADLQGFETGSTAAALLNALNVARVRNVAKVSMLTPGTDTLLEVTKTAMSPYTAAAAVIGTDSAANATLSAATDKATSTIGAIEKLVGGSDLE